MNHGSLFSGIGGPELAAEWMGWNNVFHCEINPFGKQVLNYYWPNSICYDDVKTTNFAIHRGTIDVLTGGFPCQPYSAAGLRKGKEDERHLWPYMLRAIQQIQPTWIVGENVRGIINWDGGLVFNEVQTELEAEGYEVQPFLLPASGVNAPHERYRTWFIAYSDNARTNNKMRGDKNGQAINERREKQPQYELRKNDVIANTSCTRQSCAKSLGGIAETKYMGVNGLSEVRNATNTGCSERKNGLHGEESGWETTKFGNSYTKFGAWSKFPITEPTIRSGNDGIPSELVGITVPKHRNESIKAYGNAIVPQVIHQIFKSIAEYENLYNENSDCSK